MAKLITGLGTLSGKIGAWVFSRNRWGPYIRILAIPVNPMTEYQTEQRGKVAYVAAQWQNVSGAQREAWNSFAGQIVRTDPQGLPVSYNGYSAFCLVNVERLVCSEGLILTPPELWSGDTPDAVSFSVVGSVFTITGILIGGQGPAGTGQNHLLAESAPWQSRGAEYCRSWRLFYVSPENTNFPINVSTEYQARFGAILPSDNRRYFLRIRLSQFIDPPTVPSKAYVSTRVTSTLISSVS